MIKPFYLFIYLRKAPCTFFNDLWHRSIHLLILKTMIINEVYTQGKIKNTVIALLSMDKLEHVSCSYYGFQWINARTRQLFNFVSLIGGTGVSLYRLWRDQKDSTPCNPNGKCLHALRYVSMMWFEKELRTINNLFCCSFRITTTRRLRRSSVIWSLYGFTAIDTFRHFRCIGL